MANYTEIQEVLTNKLKELYVPDEFPIIAEENTLGEKIQTDSNGALQTKYIRTVMLPVATEDLTVGVAGYDKYQGMFQIDIFTPYDNGVQETNYWVDEIINHFKKKDALTITGGLVRIVQRSRLPSTQSTNYHQCGVELEWESYLLK